ncbi:MAG: hypothetical protein ACOCQD_00300 [archaeon]
MPKGVKKLRPIEQKKNEKQNNNENYSNPNVNDIEDRISKAVEKSMEKVFEKQNKKQKLEKIFGEKEVKREKKQSDNRRGTSSKDKHDHDSSHIGCVGCGSTNLEDNAQGKIEICPECSTVSLGKEAQYGIDFYYCENCGHPVPVDYIGSNKNCPTCGHDKVR